MGIVFEKGENYNIPKNSKVKTIRYINGKIIIKYISKRNSNLSNYKKLNKDEYLDKKTGEILEYNKSQIKSKENIRRTMNKKVRPLLENNFFGGRNELFVSLTFSEDMQDFNKLPDYFKNFWKKLTRKYKNRYTFACIYVKELQVERNCWHYHLTLKDVEGKHLFITGDDLYKIWKYGNITVSRIWSGNEFWYKEIDEEKRFQNDFFLSKQDHNIKNVIDYMCKLKSKEGYIPANGKIYGTNGKNYLVAPTEKNEIIDDVYDEIEDTHILDDELTLLLKNTNTGNIVGQIHTQEWNKNV